MAWGVIFYGFGKVVFIRRFYFRINKLMEDFDQFVKDHGKLVFVLTWMIGQMQ